ncbi:MAG TPA: class IV adenylate cyclase [Patescibacteria group bacterium]|nr:class IV adenylate cyclase [Patescibacteria group bacterium]
MKTEFEIKFLNIDEEKLHKKLQALGGRLIKVKKLMRRQTFDLPEKILSGQKKWIRVRDEGDRVTMTFKNVIDKDKIDGTKEIEIIVDDFDKTVELASAVNLVKASYQENYREEWKFKNCSITVDTWPGLSPFVEIEGENEEIVKSVASKLNFNIKRGEFGSIDYIYHKVLGIETSKFNKLPVLTFNNFNKVLVNK